MKDSADIEVKVGQRVAVFAEVTAVWDDSGKVLVKFDDERSMPFEPGRLMVGDWPLTGEGRVSAGGTG